MSKWIERMDSFDRTSIYVNGYTKLALCSPDLLWTTCIWWSDLVVIPSTLGMCEAISADDLR